MDPKKRRDEAVREQQEILAKAKAEGREQLTQEEKRRFEELQETVEICQKAMEAMEEGQKDKGDDDSAERAVKDERKRATEITALCRSFNVDEKRYIESGTSVEEVRAAILEKLQKDGAPVASSRGQADVKVIASEEDKFRDAMSDAILMRGGVNVIKPADGARDLRGMSLRDIAIESLKGTVSNAARMDSAALFEELCRNYNPASAFPAIMDQTINKAYVTGYEQAKTTFEAFCTEGSLSDFKTSRHEYLAGPAGEFERVEENGELHSDKPEDALLPTRKLETYGKQFTMTRQAFIDDDIGYLTSLPARYAKASKSTINKQVYGVLTKNPVIFDGIALFDAAHKNIVAKSANIGGPTSNAIQAMIIGLSAQKNQFGEAINLTPGCIIVPVGYGFAVQTIFESATINTSGNTQAANPLYQYRQNITVVEDATLNALAAEQKMSTVPWYIAADKSDAAGIQVDYLNGQKVPTIRRMEKPGVLGFVWDVYHDWGVSVKDYRGFVKNPGEELSIEL